MKIVCIGNSIINGFPYRRSQCFVSLWRDASGFEIINKGENGDISSNIWLRFQKDVISHKPKKVFILTGTNDFIQSLNTPEEVLAYLKKMTHQAKENHIEAILMTPLLLHPQTAAAQWFPNVDYHKVNHQLQELRQLILSYCSENQVGFVDTQLYFSKLYDENTVGDYLVDGLHPTLLGHQVIAEFIQQSQNNDCK